MGQSREDLQRLASYVISARIAAGYGTRKEFAEAIGVTARTLGKLETAAERVSPDTLARVAKGVGWTPDSPARILAGLEPRADTGLSLVDREVPDPDETELARLVADHPDDRILAMIAVRGGASARTRLAEANGWLGVQEGLRNGTNG